MRKRKGMRRALGLLLSFAMLMTGMAENVGEAAAAGGGVALIIQMGMLLIIAIPLPKHVS